jgi:hypothetical protein
MARKRKTSKEIIEKLTEGGISPAEVMVETMRKLYKSHEKYMEMAELTFDDDKRMGLLKSASDCMVQACEIAKNAAPYLHAKLQSVTVGGDEGAAPIQVELKGVDELRRLIRGKPVVIPLASVKPDKE